MTAPDAPRPVLRRLLALPSHRAHRADALAAELPESPDEGMPAQAARYQALERVVSGFAGLIAQEWLSFEQADALLAILTAAMQRQPCDQGESKSQEEG